MKDLIKKAGEDNDLLESTVEHLCAWLKDDILPAWANESIRQLVEKKEWNELNDRFFKELTFGTGGLRGRTIGKLVTDSEAGSGKGCPEFPAVGSNFLNDFNLIKATMALYKYTKQYLDEAEDRFETPRLVIAHDVRHFSRHFCELAASTWTKLGGNAFIFDGPRSTPQLSFSVRYLKAHAGVVITASHNPPHDNGFKAYFEDGGQLVSPHAEAVVEASSKIELSEVIPFLGKNVDAVTVLPESIDDAYLSVASETVLQPDLIVEYSPKVVFTPIHGTGGISSMPIMEAFGVDVVEVEEQAKQDGDFPSVKSPNPENPEALAMALAKAKEVNADLVLATDPDCDRLGIAARNVEGEMVIFSGNQTGAMLAEYRINTMKDLGILPEEGHKNAAMIKTFVTSPIFEAIAKGQGIKSINTLTGFKWIGEKLNIYEKQLKNAIYEEEGLGLSYDETDFGTRAEMLLDYSTFYVFGGEESYGYLSSDLVRDKDGNAAVINLCELGAYLKKEGLTFSEYLDNIYLKYGYYIEQVINIYYEGASGASKIVNILESYRNNPPAEFDGAKMVEFTDFGRQQIYDDDGKLIPSQDFYFLKFDNGYSYACRASGTEPKIKFYVFANEKAEAKGDLDSVKKTTEGKINSFCKAIDADARLRAEG